MLGDGLARCLEHTRLAHDGVKARVIHDGGSLAEPGDVAHLGDDPGTGV